MRRSAMLLATVTAVLAGSPGSVSGAGSDTGCTPSYGISATRQYMRYTFSRPGRRPLREAHLAKMIRCQRGPQNVAKLKRERAQTFAVWKVACRGGPTRVGLASVFTGAAPGIATRSYVNPTGYWLLRSPNGIVTVQRQSDWGPASWTGREFDLTPEAASDHGYSFGGFPTDAGTWTGRFLGHRVPRGLRRGRVSVPC